MDFVWKNKFIAIATGVSLLAAVEFINIYVPDEIENKIFFKSFYLAQKIIVKLVKKHLLNIFIRFIFKNISLIKGQTWKPTEIWKRGRIKSKYIRFNGKAIVEKQILSFKCFGNSFLYLKIDFEN